MIAFQFQVYHSLRSESGNKFFSYFSPLYIITKDRTTYVQCGLVASM
jgi:hypothetical protein